jgi:hypothetical protein
MLCLCNNKKLYVYVTYLHYVDKFRGMKTHLDASLRYLHFYRLATISYNIFILYAKSMFLHL